MLKFRIIIQQCINVCHIISDTSVYHIISKKIPQTHTIYALNSCDNHTYSENEAKAESEMDVYVKKYSIFDIISDRLEYDANLQIMYEESNYVETYTALLNYII